MGLDLAPGQEFSEEVRRSCFSMVHPTLDSRNFTMVVAFGRTSLKLTEDSVTVALESITGGICDALKVSILRDRVFSFTVSSKKVGFLLIDRRKFVSPNFICYFYLWNHGGPQWLYEFNLWKKQTKEEWTLVSPSKKRARLGLNALRFSTIIDYDICKVYKLRLEPSVHFELLESGYDLLPDEGPAPSPPPVVHRTKTSLVFSLVQSRISWKKSNQRFLLISCRRLAHLSWSSNLPLLPLWMLI